MKIAYLTLIPIICLILFINMTHYVTAASPTATPQASLTPSDTKTATDSATAKTLDIINEFKDRIASRVAQLKLVKKKGMLGTVTEVTGTQITLNDTHEKTRFVDVDELTKFSSPSAKESFGLSDLTKGTRVGVLGLHNRQSNRILARFIEVDRSPDVVIGMVETTDRKQFTFTVTTNEKKTRTIDVGTSTRIQQFTKDDGTLRAGFSKITPGEMMIAVGYPDKKDASLFLAGRIILLAETGENQESTTQTPPATGSSAAAPTR